MLTLRGEHLYFHANIAFIIWEARVPRSPTPSLAGEGASGLERGREAVAGRIWRANGILAEVAAVGGTGGEAPSDPIQAQP